MKIAKQKRPWMTWDSRIDSCNRFVLSCTTIHCFPFDLLKTKQFCFLIVLFFFQLQTHECLCFFPFTDCIRSARIPSFWLRRSGSNPSTIPCRTPATTNLSLSHQTFLSTPTMTDQHSSNISPFYKEFSNLIGKIYNHHIHKTSRIVSNNHLTIHLTISYAIYHYEDKNHWKCWLQNICLLVIASPPTGDHAIEFLNFVKNGGKCLSFGVCVSDNSAHLKPVKLYEMLRMVAYESSTAGIIIELLPTFDLQRLPNVLSQYLQLKCNENQAEKLKTTVAFLIVEQRKELDALKNTGHFVFTEKEGVPLVTDNCLPVLVGKDAHSFNSEQFYLVNFSSNFFLFKEMQNKIITICCFSGFEGFEDQIVGQNAHLQPSDDFNSIAAGIEPRFTRRTGRSGTLPNRRQRTSRQYLDQPSRLRHFLLTSASVSNVNTGQPFIFHPAHSRFGRRSGH